MGWGFLGRNSLGRRVLAVLLRGCVFLGWLCCFNLSYAEENPKPIFKLIKGQGVEVCEAYLQRLNKTEFLDNDPIKGRIHEPLLKGFIELNTIPLTNEEIKHIYYKIISFEHYQDQSLLNKYVQISQNDGVESIQNKQQLPFQIKNIIEEEQKNPIVRYQALLDMDNDGSIDDTVIKNDRSIYIVDTQLQHINETRMKNIFADQEILEWKNITVFPPLATPINIFIFNNKYYFDGFVDVAVVYSSYQPFYVYRHMPKLLLGVFINEHKKTRKACEYLWVNGVTYKSKNYQYER